VSGGAPSPGTGLSISGAPAAEGAPADSPAVLQPDPARPPAPPAATERGDAAVFLGERAVGGVDLPGYLKPLVFLALLLVAIPLMLRTLVTHSGRRASLTLPVFLICAAIVLIGVYLARTQDPPDTAIGAPTPEARP
jgi:hypothetical protein